MEWIICYDLRDYRVFYCLVTSYKIRPISSGDS